ncbi:hypothetical protein L2X99_11720 [Microbacterium sp. KUDC0406]|nr:hypothetical protein [Microbacterium sp. KUDC0406]UJP11769.1 hypothetical protein L2X99_11720 [Microbacterium sp. KUDC0406]
MTIVHTPRCSTDDSTIARISEGSTRKKSMMRISSPPVQPVKCPAAIPTIVPMSIDTAVAAKPTTSETCAPHTMRTQISRPRWSVPSGCSQDGGAKRGASTSLVASSIHAGAMTGAMIAMTITTSRNTRPIMPVRLRANSLQKAAKALRRRAHAMLRGERAMVAV